jgi:hypothetical protein
MGELKGRKPRPPHYREVGAVRFVNVRAKKHRDVRRRDASAPKRTTENKKAPWLGAFRGARWSGSDYRKRSAGRASLTSRLLTCANAQKFEVTPLRYPQEYPRSDSATRSRPHSLCTHGRQLP